MLVKRCPICSSGFRRDLSYCPIDGSALETPDDPFLGLTIAGRYHVEERLGAGAMGTVYRARHHVIGRDVALKFLDPHLCTDERQRRRFLGEARAANQINHDHIIDISDYGETDGGLVYMVMEYLQGETLAKQIEAAPLSVTRALRITHQVALGLARAHQLGVVHRDVKPANIYLINRNERDFVKLLDFGVARIEQDQRITAQGTIVGTPEYIAPEQIRSAAATPATDMYALGCVLFETLTGQLPFQGNMTILLVKHLNDPVPKPSEVTADIPSEVDALVMKMMAKAPQDRHRDSYHLAEELQILVEHLPARRSAPSPVRPSEAVRSQAPPAIPEEDNWQRKLAAFQAVCSEVYPQGDAPVWADDAIGTMATGIDDIRQLRSEMGRAAERATAMEEDARAPRGQIGRALDELAHDASRVGRQLHGIEAEIARAVTRIDQLAQALGVNASDITVPIAAGTTLTAEDASQIQSLIASVEEIGEARTRLEMARKRRDVQLGARKDLSFQISQLKDQLGALHSGSTVDQEATHDAMRALDARIQERLATLEPLASKIEDHFKGAPAFARTFSNAAGG